ncbi:MAG: hypothetical protein CME30_02140 [Gemmatimonadetes bacterium]|nr:hypothetical protein [Gemmatimonadota bacterium]
MIVPPGMTPENVSNSGLPLYTLQEWSKQFPWVVAGITYKGFSPNAFDLRKEDKHCNDRMEQILQGTGFHGLARIPQVHGTNLVVHDSNLSGLVVLKDGADGHATCRSGLLLSITVADCVPVYLLDAKKRVVMLLHAGWRGVAGKIITKGIALLLERWRSSIGDIYVHFGPAICGDCYEVGPEVFRGLGLAAPLEPTTVDLREVLKGQAMGFGIREGNLTASEDCTLCGERGFFSHRNGDTGRQVALIGLRP